MKSLFKIYIYQLNSSLQSLSGIQNYECTFDYEHRGKSYFFELTNNSPSPLPTLSSKKKRKKHASSHGMRRQWSKLPTFFVKPTFVTLLTLFGINNKLILTSNHDPTVSFPEIMNSCREPFVRYSRATVPFLLMQSFSPRIFQFTLSPCETKWTCASPRPNTLTSIQTRKTANGFFTHHPTVSWSACTVVWSRTSSTI